MAAKIALLTEAAGILAKERAQGQTVAVVYGDFDLLHIGHIRQLEYAKRRGDLLVVVVSPDKLVNIGPGRPIFGQVQRMEQVASLACTDFVCPGGKDGHLGAAKQLNPDYLFVDTQDDAAPLEHEDDVSPAACEVIRCDFASLDGSASDETRIGYLPEHLQKYLTKFRQQHTASAVTQALQSLKNLRVLVIGDLIIDEYCYCRISGIVTKWPCIAAIYNNMQQMTGGGAAVARHVKELAGEVHYVCTTGDQSDNQAFVANLLAAENISHKFFTWPETFTVTKRRFLSGGYPNPLSAASQGTSANIRLFEIGFMPQTALPGGVEDALCDYIAQQASKYDAVILTDFGHGLVTPKVSEAVRQNAVWWAVNAQTNSSNYGFNMITKHRAPDFVCIDELEARLPFGDKVSGIQEIIDRLRETMHFDSAMVTRGSQGLILNTETSSSAPAFVSKVIDPIGAGDAVLSVASLCRAIGVADGITTFLSASVGALATNIVGNEGPVRKANLLRYIEGALR